MVFIKNIKQIILYGLIPLTMMSVTFSSSENSEVVTLDNLSLLKVSEENNIINDTIFEDFEDLREERGSLERGGKKTQILKNNNKDSELEIITNYVIRKATEHKELSYLLEKNLPHKVIYKQLVPSLCFFFFKVNMFLYPRLYVLGNIFCWLGLISCCIVCYFFFLIICDLFEYLKNRDISQFYEEYEIDKALLFYVFTGIIIFITIMNGGLLGYKYGTNGKYDFFLNMILYPIVTYICPILYSITFFGFFYPDYEDSKGTISFIITIILYTLLLLSIGITKLVNSFSLLIYKKSIQAIEGFAKEYIINNSLNCNFISTNFTFVGYMFALYLTSIISAFGGVAKLIYTIVQFRKNKETKEGNSEEEEGKELYEEKSEEEFVEKSEEEFVDISGETLKHGNKDSIEPLLLSIQGKGGQGRKSIQLKKGNYSMSLNFRKKWISVFNTYLSTGDEKSLEGELLGPLVTQGDKVVKYKGEEVYIKMYIEKTKGINPYSYVCLCKSTGDLIEHYGYFFIHVQRTDTQIVLLAVYQHDKSFINVLFYIDKDGNLKTHHHYPENLKKI